MDELIEAEVRERMDEILMEVGWDGTCQSCEELALRLAKMELESFVDDDAPESGVEA